jgi:hypothetical protein
MEMIAAASSAILKMLRTLALFSAIPIVAVFEFSGEHLLPYCMPQEYILSKAKISEILRCGLLNLENSLDNDDALGREGFSHQSADRSAPSCSDIVRLFPSPCVETTYLITHVMEEGSHTGQVRCFPALALPSHPPDESVSSRSGGTGTMSEHEGSRLLGQTMHQAINDTIEPLAMYRALPEGPEKNRKRASWSMAFPSALLPREMDCSAAACFGGRPQRALVTSGDETHGGSKTRQERRTGFRRSQTLSAKTRRVSGKKPLLPTGSGT